jgi:hypothetical protein
MAKFASLWSIMFPLATSTTRTFAVLVTALGTCQSYFAIPALLIAGS